MKKQLFNEGWTFGEGTATSLSFLMDATAGGNKKPPRPVTLPHDAMIESERADFFAGACTGFYQPKNIYYTKTFEIPEEDVDKCVWIEFEGVFQFAFVYVNDQLAGKCMNGYTNHFIDITKYVDYQGENTLKVVIRNGCESSRWYSGEGIYRNVNIYTGNQIHVKCTGTKVATVELEDEYALLELETPVEYLQQSRKTVRVINEIIDSTGNIVASENTPLTVNAPSEKKICQKINITDAHPWSLNTPYLYTVKTTIMEGEEVLDTCESAFGIRTLKLDAVHGLRINGKEVKLKGGCLHHDNGIIGTATFMESEERRLRKLQAAGFNAVRTGAHPFATEVLEICDRIGMLVYDELYDAWTVSKVAFDTAFSFQENWEKDVTNLVLRDYNHPSVIFYGIGNEITELGTADAQDWARKLSQKVHELDHNRFTTLSMNPLMCMLDRMGEVVADLTMWAEQAAGEPSGETAPVLDVQPEEGEVLEINSTMNQLNDEMEFLWQHPLSSSLTEEASAQVDITGLNYATGLYDINHNRYPNKVMFGSETYPKYLAKNWEVIERSPYVLGDFCWTAWDYLGEAGIGEIDHNAEEKGPMDFYGNWPWRTASVGVFDLIGDETPIGYWRELVWNNRTAPYIAVRPPEFYDRPTHPGKWNWISDCISSWTWNGYEGKPIEIEVYSRALEVELFINGKSIGTQKTGEIFQYVALFTTEYIPGEIKAVDSNGQEFVLQSASDDNVICTYIDERELNNQNRELTYIEISLCDEKHILNASSCKKLQIQLEGDGVVQGFGTANPKTEENFYDTEIEVYHGRALAVVRHNASRGPVAVTFSADGCESQTVTI